METNQRTVFLQTKLRNLKRKYAKIKEHADLGEDAIELKAEIDSIERELNSWNIPIYDDVEFKPS